MVAYVDGLFPKPTTELRDICNSYMVERPKRILVESLWAFLNANLDTVCE